MLNVSSYDSILNTRFVGQTTVLSGQAANSEGSKINKLLPIPKDGQLNVKDAADAIKATNEVKADPKEEAAKILAPDKDGNVPALETLLDAFNKGILDPRKIGNVHQQYKNSNVNIYTKNDKTIYFEYKMPDSSVIVFGHTYDGYDREIQKAMQKK